MLSGDSRERSNWDPWSSIPSEFNLGEALTRGQVEAGRGDKAAILWENAAQASRALTYAELDAVTSRLASSLARLGVKRGDRVFLRLPNIPEFYIAALAVAKLGGVFIPSSTQFRASEVEYRLKDSGAVAAITTSGLVDVIDEAAANAPRAETDHCRPVPGAGATGRRSTSISIKLVSRGERGVRPGTDSERRHRVHRLHLGHDRRPEGGGSLPPLPDRLRRAGAVLARLPAGRRGRLPVGARLAAAGRVDISVCLVARADGRALRRDGRPVRCGAMVLAVPEVSHHELHGAADDFYRMMTGRGRRGKSIRHVFLAARGQRGRAAARRHAGNNPAAVRHHADRRHRHDRVHGLLLQSSRHAAQAGKLRPARAGNGDRADGRSICGRCRSEPKASSVSAATRIRG